MADSQAHSLTSTLLFSKRQDNMTTASTTQRHKYSLACTPPQSVMGGQLDGSKIFFLESHFHLVKLRHRTPVRQRQTEPADLVLFCLRMPSTHDPRYDVGKDPWTVLKGIFFGLSLNLAHATRQCRTPAVSLSCIGARNLLKKGYRLESWWCASAFSWLAARLEIGKQARISVPKEGVACQPCKHFVVNRFLGDLNKAYHWNSILPCHPEVARNISLFFWSFSLLPSPRRAEKSLWPVHARRQIRVVQPWSCQRTCRATQRRK